MTKIQKLLSLIAKFRFENDFYVFPFEYWLITFYIEKFMPMIHSLNVTRLSKQGEGVLAKKVSSTPEIVQERHNGLKAGSLYGVTFRSEFGGIDPRTLDFSEDAKEDESLVDAPVSK